MKCPGCGAKYSGKKCPNCGRHTDPQEGSKRITRIAVIAIVAIFVVVIAYVLISNYLYFSGINDMIKNIIG